MSKVVDFSEHKISLYDFNKTNMAQVKPYDPIALNKLCGKAASEIWDSNFLAEEPKDKIYWMLLCRERNDYTIFCIEHDVHELASALVECLSNRGYVLDISRQDDGNYEIWIRDVYTQDNVVYYLFDYNGAIVEV